MIHRGRPGPDMEAEMKSMFAMLAGAAAASILLCLVGAERACAVNHSADVDVANCYDDAWEYKWASSMHNVHKSFSGTRGLVIHVGDSITYASPATSWIRYGKGRTPEDNAIRKYMHVDEKDETDGVFLARWDGDKTPPLNRSKHGSFTAESGMTTTEYLKGPQHGLPTCDAMFVTGAGTDGKYNDFRGRHAAEVCFVMLGTNDASAKMKADVYRRNLVAIVTKIMQRNNTIVCLVTIPPHCKQGACARAITAVIRDVARNGVRLAGGRRVYFPLVDYYRAIIDRRPDDWDGTLLNKDDVHPTARGSASDPYANGGENLSSSGYLLGCWLRVQKMKEIKRYCIDGRLPPRPGRLGRNR